MKKLLLTAWVLIFTVTPLFAQLDSISVNELSTIANKKGFTQHLEPIGSKYNQAATIKQVGNNNTATITQNGTNLYAYILQNGNNLNADLTLKGSENNAIIKQKGTDLLTKVKLTGHNNDFKLLQAGRDLRNHIKLINVSKMNVQLLQTNTNFYYSQSGQAGINFKLNSTRDIPTIIVRNN